MPADAPSARFVREGDDYAAVHPAVGGEDLDQDGLDDVVIGGDGALRVYLGSPSDADGDGSLVEVYGAGDCDDTDAGVNPDAREVLGDEVDQGCDGTGGEEESGLPEAPAAPTPCSCAGVGDGGQAWGIGVLTVLVRLHRRTVRP